MKLVEELGERKIIEIILGCLDPMPKTPIPFGDDVSAVDLGRGRLAVLKTDMLVGKTDVPPGMSFQHAARKAVVMNVSDLAAKGVKPIAILASLGVPQGLTEKDVEDIGKGLNDGAREYGAYVLGGDTNEASDLVIGCAAFGLCESRYLVKRSGARPGDLVGSTGLFGKTSSGLKILLENLPVPQRLGKVLVNSVFNPSARLREGLVLAKTGAVTASIDSSDGMAWSLYEISRASNVGFTIDHLPVASEAKEFAEINNLDPVEMSLYGGEEYELLVTIKPKLWDVAERALERIGASLIKIGLVTKEKSITIRIGEKSFAVEARGWEHFKTADSEK